MKTSPTVLDKLAVSLRVSYTLLSCTPATSNAYSRKGKVTSPCQKESVAFSRRRRVTFGTTVFRAVFQDDTRGSIQDYVMLGTLLPLAGVAWNFLAMAVVLAVRECHGSDDWKMCVRSRDLSDVLADSYFWSVVVWSIQVLIFTAFNYLMAKMIRETAFPQFFGPKQANALKILGYIIPCGLMGILLFTRGGTTFVCLFIYFVLSVIFYTLKLLHEEEWRSTGNVLSVLYFVLVTVVFAGCLIAWRVGRAQDPTGKIVRCSFYEWISLLCMSLWFVPYTYIFYRLREKPLPGCRAKIN